MKVRHLLAALAAALSFGAQAASGPYSGIWQNTTGDFIFVSHNGADLIVTTYTNVPASGIYAPLNNGQYFALSTLDVGDLIKGQVFDGFALLSGIAAYRACNLEVAMTFHTANSMTAEFYATRETAEGAQQGINCVQILNNSNAAKGTYRAFTKVF